MRPLGARTVRMSLLRRKRRTSSISKSRGSWIASRSLPAFHAQGEDEVFSHQVVGDQIDGVGGDGVFIQIDIFHVVLLGQGFVDVDLVAQLEVDQGFADAKAFGFGVFEGLGDLAGLDDSPFDENLTDFFLLLGHCGYSFEGGSTLGGTGRGNSRYQ